MEVAPNHGESLLCLIYYFKWLTDTVALCLHVGFTLVSAAAIVCRIIPRRPAHGKSNIPVLEAIRSRLSVEIRLKHASFVLEKTWRLADESSAI